MKYIKHFFSVLIIASLFSSCDSKDDNTITGDNLQTVISQNADLSLFAAAITRAKLEYFLNGPGPFTIFAPNNAAFNAAGIMTAADLNAIDTNLLVSLLTFHIQAGARTSFEVPRGPNANMVTQGGFSFYGTNNSDGVFVNGSRLIKTDIRASNGIVHIINSLLNPPLNNSLAALTLNPNHTLFVQAATKTATTANVAASLVTVFAPTNAAMIAGGYDSTTIANLNTTAITLLGNIVKYHIFTGRLFSTEFKDGNLKTVQGTNVVLSSGGTKIKGTTNTTPFNIVTRNIAVSNGVIHTIDGLLKY